MKFHQHVLTVAAALTLGALAAGTASADPASPALLGKGGSAAAALTQTALAPGNDNFGHAQLLPSTNGSISGSNTGSTAESGEPSHGDQLNPANNSVWYSWIAPATGRAIFRTIGSNYDTVMAAYTEGAKPGVADLRQEAANDDLVLNNSTVASQIRFAVVAGRRYFIAVDGFANATGTIKLTWTTNDDFDAAQTLLGPAEGSFATFAVHNEGATPQLGEPRHAGQVSTTSVWYKWTAPFTGNATFQTTQSNYDTVLAVYTGTRVDQLTEVASNNDQQAGVRRSKVVFSARAGQTYRIALAGFGGQSGFEVVNYQLARRQIVAGDASTTEGAGSKVLNLPVSLTVASPVAVKVHFATADGTAKAGSDYAATSGDLTFAPGQTSTSVPVTIKGDGTKEAAETFSLRLSNPTSDYTFKDAVGTGTIVNDD